MCRGIATLVLYTLYATALWPWYQFMQSVNCYSDTTSS